MTGMYVRGEKTSSLVLLIVLASLCGGVGRAVVGVSIERGEHIERGAGIGLGDRIEPPPDVGRGEWSAVSDKDVGRVTVEDALHRRTVTAAVLGEEVPQRVTRADSPTREAASDEIADDGIAVIEQDDVGARGVAAGRDHLCSHSVVVEPVWGLELNLRGEAGKGGSPDQGPEHQAGGSRRRKDTVGAIPQQRGVGRANRDRGAANGDRTDGTGVIGVSVSQRDQG